MNCDQARLSLGAYLFGAIDRAEGVEVEEHVRDCPACRAELADLAELPPLLDRLTPADVERLEHGFAGEDPGAQTVTELRPSPDLLDRLLAAASRRHRWRRLLVSVAVAAAVLTAALGGGSMILSLIRPAPPDQVVVLTGADPGTQVHGQARLTARPWGTSITVDIAGLPAGTECSLVAVAADGRRQSLGAWEADYSGTADVTVATSYSLSEIASLVINDRDHEPLLRLRR
ncbi:zf-HC2 domain-containing protein [Microlunatus parietis]|uniref:Anti-sigma factor RsiW n=1 Tax=Microlunatus parietis TaxID=682979 RepID=A0A7Y9LEX9_9ACTN|nr:zf-HC2 domain-containing protein [Microlunatus parietis]NYE73516.1 anti-sigma factor RsiW [Microlunatus parietis]